MSKNFTPRPFLAQSPVVSSMTCRSALLVTLLVGAAVSVTSHYSLADERGHGDHTHSHADHSHTHGDEDNHTGHGHDHADDDHAHDHDHDHDHGGEDDHAAHDHAAHDHAAHDHGGEDDHAAHDHGGEDDHAAHDHGGEDDHAAHDHGSQDDHAAHDHDHGGEDDHAAHDHGGEDDHAAHDHDHDHDRGIPEDWQTRDNPLPLTDEVLASGLQIYQAYCSACHGPTGQGDGLAPAAAYFDPSPTDLALHGPAHGAGEYAWIIRQGNPASAMPRFDTKLNEAQIWSVVHYIRHGLSSSGEYAQSHRH